MKKIYWIQSHFPVSLKVRSKRGGRCPGTFSGSGSGIVGLMFLCLFPQDITHLNQTEAQVQKQQADSPRPCSPWPGAADLRRFEKRPLETALPSSLDQVQSSRQKRSVDNTGLLGGPNWPQYFRDQGDPNPCQNEGICVNVKGMVSCR